jgi:hypothetical protein
VRRAARRERERPSPLPPARRAATGRPARPPFRRRAIGLVALAAVTAALLRWARVEDPSPPPAPQDPRAAYQAALARVAEGRFHESLPWFREALRGAPDLWRIHHDYAASLLNAAHESRERQRVLGFVARGSPERVTLVREALEHLARAERLGGGEPGAVAQARRTRAQAMRAWGFPWEAFAAYRQAEWADSGAAGRADALMELLEHPAGRDPVAVSLPAARGRQ